jgi:hypothetical protein
MSDVELNRLTNGQTAFVQLLLARVAVQADARWHVALQVAADKVVPSNFRLGW